MKMLNSAGGLLTKMNKTTVTFIGSLLLIVGFISLIVGYSLYTGRTNPEVKGDKTKPSLTRETVPIQISLNKSDSFPNVEANKSPKFTLDISNPKFNQLLNSTSNQINNLVEAKIVHEAYADQQVEAYVSVDKNNKRLIVQPGDLENFKPGLYKLSLKMRTTEGYVNIDQDFTWGVIAINTNKSIYKPGEKVKLGIGVLNNNGDTLCLTGDDKVDEINMIIKDPAGNLTNFSTNNKTIRDSGKCGPITVTNEADFQANYSTTQPGIYQMIIKAKVAGHERQITDYFKVDPSVKFDVERTSFPTRIYPRSIYPNTFTVTASEDYAGQVVDIVPASFRVEHISDNGKLVKFGDFYKIVWDTKLSAGKPKLFTYFIHFPQVSPEFYLIGPIQIGDFKEARQWQIASDAINSTSGLVTYEDNGGANTFDRVWTGTTWNPALSSVGDTMDTSPADSRWFREVSSPKTGEKIVGLVDNVAANDQLYIFTWSGSAWTQDKNFALSSTVADVTRPFDVAYEELSGDALFVFSDYSTNQLRYIKRVAGVWDTGTVATDFATAGTGFDVFKRWVRLQPKFNSDSILVGYLNDNERVGAMIWDGSTNTFGDQFSDASGTATATSADAPFDIAWETSSGTPMIFWGTTGNALIYREFTSSTWQAEANVTTGLANDLAWVKAGADPISTSNNISLALQDGTTCVARFAVWTGSSASVNGTTQSCRTTGENNLVDTAFEANTGKAMFVYVLSATGTQISWQTWTSGGGFTSNTTEAGASANIDGVQLYSDLNTNSMMLLYHDDAATCDLWDREWDGSAWSAKGATAVYDTLCDAADNDTEPYGFGFDRNLEQQVAYRWFANNSGTSVVTALTSQDTPYTLTTANQKFRLRMLVYTTDTLTTSLRNYKLQYVDPGTGTCASPTGGTPSIWTDVPSSGGTTISFYNDTPADGATLTTNALDPTYQGKTKNIQTYEEANNFTNTVSSIPADQVGEWDFSLIDNSTYDRNAQTFCFRIARTSDVVLQIGLYPQISTAALNDVLIQGGSLIQGGTQLR